MRLLREVLTQEYGWEHAPDPSGRGPFLYLDDVLFTGNRIILDLRQWLQTAPRRAQVIIAVLVCYRRGLLYTHRAILRAAAEVGKTVRVYWLRSLEFENRPWAAAAREGFHPTTVPDDSLARDYLRRLEEGGRGPWWRPADGASPCRLFTSEAGRHLVEQQLLLAGLKIRSLYRNPQDALRPLGYDTLKDLGFGATVVTYRNCPNNCPLAWWWDTAAVPATCGRGHWYPLFPRKV